MVVRMRVVRVHGFRGLGFRGFGFLGCLGQVFLCPNSYVMAL